MAKKQIAGDQEVINEGVNPNARPSGIIVNASPATQKELPLIVVLPDTASKAQIERAKVLNGFAYQFPKRWEERKERLLKELEALADAPDPVEDGDMRLEVGPKVPTIK